MGTVVAPQARQPFLSRMVSGEELNFGETGGRLQVVSVESNSVGTVWEPVNGAACYHVYAREATNPTSEFRAVGPNLTDCKFLISKLHPGVDYVVKVIAEVEVGHAVVRGCGNVTRLSVTETTRESISLAWDSAPGATFYRVECRKLHTQPSSTTAINRVAEFTQVSDCSTPSCDVKGLEIGASYEFRVRAGSGKFVHADGAVVSGTPIAPVQNLRITELTATSATVEWETTPGAARFKVERQNGSTNICEVITERLTERRCYISGLEPGIPYTIRVFAAAPMQEFEKHGASVQVVPLPPPSSLQVMSIKQNSVSLKWDKGTHGASNYLLQMETVGSDAPIQNILTRTQCLIENLQPGREYRFRLFNGTGGNQFETIGTAPIIVTPLAAPTNLVVSDMTATSVVLGWEAVASASRYKVICLADSDARSKHPQTSSKSWVVTEHCTTNSMTVGQLTPGSSYMLQVFAGVDSGFEDQGASVSVCPHDPARDLRVVSLRANAVSLAWISSTGPYTVFSVQCATAENPTQWTGTVARKNSIDLDSLQTNTTYLFRVHVGDGNFFEKQGSNLLQVTPVEPVSRPQVTTVESSRVGLTWEVSKGSVVDRFKVCYAQHGTPRDTLTASMLAGSSKSVHSQTSQWQTVHCRTASCMLEHLMPGAQFDVVVFAGTESGFETGGESIKVMALQPVTDLKVTSVRGSAVVVEWTQSPGATHYIVDKRPNGTEREYTLENDHVSNNGCEVVIPQPGVPFQIRVRAAFRSLIECRGATVTATALSMGSSLTMDELRRMTLDQLREAARKLGTLSEHEIMSMTEEQLRDWLANHGLANAIRVKELTATSVRLVWNVAAGASRYKIEKQNMQSSNGFQLVSDNVRTNTFVVDSLETGADYVIRVFAGTDAHVFADEGLSTTIRPLPSPQSVQVTSLLESSVSLQWQPVQFASQYLVEVVASNGHAQRVSSHSPKASVDDLQVGTEYTLRVFSGHANKFETVGSRPPLRITPLSPPQELRVETITESSVVLVWSQTRVTSCYRVQYTIAGDTRTFVACEACTTGRFEVTQLKAGQHYTFTVFSGAADGSFESKGVSIVAVPMGTVSKVFVEANTEAEVAIAWESVVGATAYKLLVDPPISGHSEKLVATQPRFSCRGLRAGVPYTFTVFGGSLETNMFESKGGQVVVTPLPPPTMLKAAFVTDSGVRLQWAEVPNATRFMFEYRAMDSKKGFRTMSDNCTIPSVELGGLKAGRDYEFRVRSGCASGFETAGAVVRAMPLENVQNITVEELRSESVTCSWTPVNGATSYQVDLVVGENELTPIATVTDTRFRTAILKAGSTNTIRIRASRNGVMQLAGITFELKPLAVSQVRLLSITASSATLDWDRVDGATKYMLEWVPVDGSGVGGGRRENANGPATVEGLVSGVEYEFKVRVGSKFGFDTGGAVARAIPLEAPTDLKTKYENGILLAWTPPPGADRYRVEMRLKAEKFEYPWQTMTTDYENTRLHLVDLHPFVKYMFRVFAGSKYAYETNGVTETMEVILEPRDPKELERAVDRSVRMMLKALESEIPGISLITTKVGPNLYKIGDKTLALTILRGMIVCRVGGGYMDLALWILQHKEQLLRYIDRNQHEILGAIDTVAKVRTENSGVTDFDEDNSDAMNGASPRPTPLTFASQPSQGTLSTELRSRSIANLSNAAPFSRSARRSQSIGPNSTADILGQSSAGRASRNSIGGLAAGVVPMFLRSGKRENSFNGFDSNTYNGNGSPMSASAAILGSGDGRSRVQVTVQDPPPNIGEVRRRRSSNKWDGWNSGEMA